MKKEVYRKTKFRGQDLATGKWVYGDLLHPITSCRIVNYTEVEEDGVKRADYHYYDVDPDTVGQFTGLYDKGTEIYEGDIVRCDSWFNSTVFYHDELCAFIVGNPHKQQINLLCDFQEIRVVGNIFDNPDLLEK